VCDPVDRQHSVINAVCSDLQMFCTSEFLGSAILSPFRQSALLQMGDIDERLRGWELIVYVSERQELAVLFGYPVLQSHLQSQHQI